MNMKNEKTNSSKIGKRNRTKGADTERYYADLFRGLGFTHCITARLGGRIHDNAGIDLINIPYNIQIKGGKHKNLSPGKILLNMYSQINSLFPENSEIRSNPLLLFHRPFIYRKNNNADYVYYTLEQHKRFQETINNPDFEYESIKVRKAEVSNEFGSIVKVPFESFKNNVLLYKRE